MAARNDMAVRRRRGAVAAARARGAATQKSRPRGAPGVGNDDHDVVRRVRAELDRRRSRPNPAARPSVVGSAALAALERNLKQATDPALRQKLEAMIASVRALYRPPMVEQVEPVEPPTATFRARPGSMKEYVAELVQRVHHRDRHGRDVGLHYAVIGELARARFPTILNGRYRGRATRCAVREMAVTAAELRRAGVRLPIRPRRRASTRSPAPTGA